MHLTQGNRRYVSTVISHASVRLIIVIFNDTQNGGFATPAEIGMLTNLVEMGQARDKILSLQLDQVNFCVSYRCLRFTCH